MGMMTERGRLIFGVERDGQDHRDFEIRPTVVGDTLDAYSEHGTEKLGNDLFCSLCMTAKQILYIGDIRPIPVECLLKMQDEDFREISKAKERLAARLATFRDGRKNAEPDQGAALHTGESGATENACPLPVGAQVSAESGAEHADMGGGELYRCLGEEDRAAKTETVPG